MAGSRAVLFLALRDLKRDRRIFIMVVFLLTFSYVNLTFFPAFLNGLSDVFQSEIVDTTTGHLLLQPRTGNQYLGGVGAILQKLDLIPGVAGSSAHLDATATLAADGNTVGARLTALTPSRDAPVTTIEEKVVDGSFLSDDDRGQIVLGRLIAGERLEDRIGETNQFGTLTEGLGGVQPGDLVTVTFQNGVSRQYRVKGIVSSIGFSFVSSSVYLTKRELEDVLGLDDQATSVLVRLQSAAAADAAKQIVLGLGIKQAEILTWKEASNFAEGLNATFGIVNIVTGLVAVVIVLATVSIVVFINTARKKRIIGVLKAIGMRESLVLRVFLVESLVFGTIGALLGAGLMALALSSLQTNPIMLPLGPLRPFVGLDVLAGSALLIIAISVVAGYFPSRIASRAEIIESLKAVE